MNSNQRLVHHHIKYKEIHGEDKVVLMELSEHIKLHRRLRKEGKCNISSKELLQISIAARERTDKRINYLIEHRKTEQWKKYAKQYRQINTYTFYFNTPMMPCVRLCEPIEYNLLTGSVYFESLFQATNGKHLIEVLL